MCAYDLGRRDRRHRQPQGHDRLAAKPEPRRGVLLDDRPLGQLGRDRLDCGDEAARAKDHDRVCSAERLDVGYRALSSPGRRGQRHCQPGGRLVSCEGIKAADSRCDRHAL
jgi:hypothetical protein